MVTGIPSIFAPTVRGTFYRAIDPALRDAHALEAAGIHLADAVAPWQEVVAAGEVPRSWIVRDRLVGLGANGLIDPSRKSPLV